MFDIKLYNLSISEHIVGFSLSERELGHWLTKYEEELNTKDKLLFRRGLGFPENSEEDWGDFVLNILSKVPIITPFKNETMKIDKYNCFT